MAENKNNSDEPVAAAGTFYDRIAGLYNLTFKFNGYQRSLRRYLRQNPLSLPRNARILDAGCGTGLLTITLLKTLESPTRIYAVDLSGSSLETARKAVWQEGKFRHSVEFAQGNVLQLPFDDDSFDFIVTSGALEYVSLSEGFEELARVLRPRGYLLHLPVKPSVMSRLLELMFKFKAHPPLEITENTNKYFRLVRHDEFPPFDPIGWTKTAVLAQKE